MPGAPLKITPPTPPSAWETLLRQAPKAANSDGIPTLVRTAAKEVIVVGAEKSVLRGIFAWMGSALSGPMGVALSVLDIPSDTPQRPQPISIDTQGRPFNEQFVAEFDEVSRLLMETSALQTQIKQYELLGLTALIPMLREQLDTLQMHVQTIAKGYGVPALTHTIQIKAQSAVEVDSTTPATPASEDDSQMLHKLDTLVANSAHLNEEQKQYMHTLIQQVSIGEAPIDHITYVLWEMLRDDFLIRAAESGAIVTLQKTDWGPLYRIEYRPNVTAQHDAIHWMRWILEATNVRARATPSPFYYPTLPVDNPPIIYLWVPSWEYLTRAYPKAIQSLYVTVPDVTGDDVHALHKEGRSILQLTLTDHYLDDVGAMVPPFVFMVHDIYHALIWQLLPQETKALSFGIYDKVRELLSGQEQTETFGLLCRIIIDANVQDLSPQALQWAILNELVKIRSAQNHIIVQKIFDIVESFNIPNPPGKFHFDTTALQHYLRLLQQ